MRCFWCTNPQHDFADSEGLDGAAAPALLPLDGCRGFAGDVEADAVDAFDFVGDAAGDTLKDFVRQLDPVGGHAVLGFDGAQGDGVIVGALVAHDTNALSTLLTSEVWKEIFRQTRGSVRIPHMRK